MHVLLFFISVYSANVDAQISIMITASASPQAADIGGDTIMQCSYTVDPQHSLRLQWLKTIESGQEDIVIWTAYTNGSNAATDNFQNKLRLFSVNPLSNGHAIRMFNIQPDDQGYYSCFIYILSTSRGNTSNNVQISVNGMNNH